MAVEDAAKAAPLAAAAPVQLPPSAPEPASSSSSMAAAPPSPRPLAEAAAVPATAAAAAAAAEVPCKSDEEREREQATFYERLLFGVLLPYFAESASAELVPRRSLRVLFGRADLPPETVRLALDIELGPAADEGVPCVDVEALQRVGRLVAFAQERGWRYEAELRSGRGFVPLGPPQLRGLAWDGRRLRTLEPILDDGSL